MDETSTELRTLGTKNRHEQCSPRTELAAGPADEFQKPLMVVANFCGDAVTDATIAACSLLPVVPASPAAAGPTWSAVARVAFVSTLTERRLSVPTTPRLPV
ncbi:hypothetical protein ACI65C_002724 [Semiaphis heraclei]